jgi:hypothetical protein
VLDYRTSAGVALDEVIDRIEITELIPLNPNRVPLR